MISVVANLRHVLCGVWSGIDSVFLQLVVRLLIEYSKYL
jgi:hypothetical protein